jgi:hypothetical protein
MKQRPLRLGDLLDDYCPRERRITNHAIVAIVNDAIRQTRCTTCDAEHVYRAGKAPRRRKKDSTSELYDEVLANAGGQLVAPEPPAEASPPEPEPIQAPELAADASRNGNSEIQPDEPPRDDVWSAHRPLIRATLPRTEGDQPPPRPIPEFTMHQRQVRGGHQFRQGWFDRNAGHGRDASRGNGGPNHGSGSGHNQGRPRRHGHKKRSR